MLTRNAHLKEHLNLVASGKLAAVMLAKFYLKRVIGMQRLDYEELSTTAAQVESCLNSCTLLQLNSHSQDGVSILTPGHFLIGSH